MRERIRHWWRRFLEGWNLAWGIPVPEDEIPPYADELDDPMSAGHAKDAADIYYAADYERDLMHDTGEDEFDTWIARNQDEYERWLA